MVCQIGTKRAGVAQRRVCFAVNLWEHIITFISGPTSQKKGHMGIFASIRKVLVFISAASLYMVVEFEDHYGGRRAEEVTDFPLDHHLRAVILL